MVSDLRDHGNRDVIRATFPAASTALAQMISFNQRRQSGMSIGIEHNPSISRQSARHLGFKIDHLIHRTQRKSHTIVHPEESSTCTVLTRVSLAEACGEYQSQAGRPIQSLGTA